MIVNAYVVIDPKGDRPYVSTTPPGPELDRTKVKVFHYALLVPDDVPADDPMTFYTPEKV
jgi:hypothetical protein